MSRQDTGACEHLRAQLKDRTGSVKSEPDADEGIEDRYRAIISSFNSRKRKRTPPTCQACGSSKRPWMCLNCNHTACFTGKECMKKHLKKGNCGFAIDPSSGPSYCKSCDDLVYSDTLEDIYTSSRLQIEEKEDNSGERSSLGIKKRIPYRPWPSSSFVEDDDKSSKVTCRGLRPLINLSQTCFLSAVLQSLIHNPMFKSYFLSEKHNRHLCSSSRGLAIGKPLNPEDKESREKGCMCCEMDRAFEEFHADDSSPFGAITMLYSMWHASAELEGYGQQDAHSFFLAALDQVHAHAKGQLSSCNCIAHQTFAGSLLSSVTCSSCHKTSTTIDPILDIQLDFPSDIVSESSNGNGTGNGKSHGNKKELTLATMLRKFCAEEKIGGGSSEGRGYDCAHCDGGQNATRRLVVKKLPPVLAFQLKRFAHHSTSIKIEYPVKFPSVLNMQPYVSDNNASESSYIYDLFSVVTHEGKLDNGHYWADVLTENNEWYHCDDDKITPTTLKSVLGQKAYMLFYVKRVLGYGKLYRFKDGEGGVEKDTKVDMEGQEGKKKELGSLVNSGVGGKGLGNKGLNMGGKSSHPIKGMIED